MKLLNYTSTYLALPLFLLLSLWAAVFYFELLDDIYDSIEDVLQHQKAVVIQKAAEDPSILSRSSFEDSYYTIKEIGIERAQDFKEVYLDSLMYLQAEDEYGHIRILNTVFQHDGKQYQLKLFTSMVEEDKLVKKLLYSLLWLYAGLLTTILLLNNLTLKKIWMPFYQVLNRMQQFRLESPVPVELPATKVDEFKLLNTAVNRVLLSNSRSFNQQKQFLENASHELQTPLAITINKLELLAEENTLTEEQAALLHSALRNLSRMTRLNKSLLLLSRIENRQFPESKEVDVGKLVEELLFDFKEQFEYQELTVNVHQSEPCKLSIHPDLCEILFTNLVKNALIHNQKGGFISIWIAPQSFTIENSGSNHHIEEAVIFNRFYKGDPAGKSTGLGLTISKAITDLYGYQFRYRYEGRHVFTLHFG